MEEKWLQWEEKQGGFYNKIGVCRYLSYYQKISLNNTSDTFRSFIRKRTAKCFNGQAKTGRLYQLTTEGEEIREELMKGIN